MKIIFIKPVSFLDEKGTELTKYPVGHIIEASADVGHYYVTPMGGIYKDEAQLVSSDDSMASPAIFGDLK